MNYLKRNYQLIELVDCKCRCGSSEDAIVTKDVNFNDLWFVFCPTCNISTGYYKSKSEAIEAWKKVMSVRKGRWIIHYDDLFPEESTRECDQCHEEQTIWSHVDYNYCPNCGAKMEKS